HSWGPSWSSNRSVPGIRHLTGDLRRLDLSWSDCHDPADRIRADWCRSKLPIRRRLDFDYGWCSLDHDQADRRTNGTTPLRRPAPLGWNTTTRDPKIKDRTIYDTFAH